MREIGLVHMLCVCVLVVYWPQQPPGTEQLGAVLMRPMRRFDGPGGLEAKNKKRTNYMRTDSELQV